MALGAPAPPALVLLDTIETVGAPSRAPALSNLRYETDGAGGATFWRLRQLLHSGSTAAGAGAPSKRA